uniref:Uncharacterized protein n=1 Tax=Setaria viridis TaxID=4556 RepID=A0A4U6WCM4_SETVI|nr:hypothetical protein SEVIR_1G181466v2 [Setaria viridis]
MARHILLILQLRGVVESLGCGNIGAPSDVVG